MPNSYAFISLFSFFVVLFVGAFVFFTSVRKPIHIIFFILCLFNAYIAFPEFMMRQAGDPQTALSWLKIQSFWHIVGAVVIHFSLIFIGKGRLFRNWWVWLLVYGPYFVITYCYFLPGVIFDGVAKMPWGYSTIDAPLSPVSIAVIACPTVLGIFPVAIVGFHLFKIQSIKEKKQTQFVFLGLLSPYFLATMSMVIIPTFFQTTPPELVTIGVAFQAIFIGYGVWRYDLFDLNPAAAAENIIAAMSDMQVLLNSDGKIVSANQAAIEVLGYSENDLMLMPVADLLPDKDIDHFLATARVDHFGVQTGVPHGDNLNYYDGELVIKNGRLIPVSIAVSALWDRDGELAGYVVIARDMTPWKKAEQEKNDLIAKLQAALANIKTLKGLIPICSACGLVRNDDGYWQKVDEYLSEQVDVDFSHGLCEKCAQNLYPDFYPAK